MERAADLPALRQRPQAVLSDAEERQHSGNPDRLGFRASLWKCADSRKQFSVLISVILIRVRSAMERDPMAGSLAGRVVADETWIGGKPSNRHGRKRGKGGQGKTDKTPAIALVFRATGEVDSQVVADVTGDTLGAVLAERADARKSHLH